MQGVHKNGAVPGCENGAVQSRNSRVADRAARRQAEAFAGMDPFEAKLSVQVEWLNGGEAFQVPLLTSITDDLWIGGVVPGATLPERFVHVVACHPWTPWTILHAVRSYQAFPMTDDQAGTLPAPALLDALAAWVNVCRQDGTTLVHCAVGLNRSALVAGLALVRDGMDPGMAITMLRAKRSEYALCNPAFEAFLRGQTPPLPPGWTMT